MSLKTILESKNKHIDKLVVDFESQISGLSKGLRADLIGLFKTGNYDRKLISALFTKHGYEAAALDFIDKHKTVFKYAKDIGGELGIGFNLNTRSLGLLEKISEANLQTILTRKDAIINSIIDAGLQSEVEKLPFRQIVSRLDDTIIQLGRRVSTEAYTGVSIFDRVVRAEQMEAAGVEKFVYMGPYDGKTRDACGSVLSDSRQQTGWTIAEIHSSQVDFIAGGGYNCRHDWLAFVEGVAPEKVGGEDGNVKGINNVATNSNSAFKVQMEALKTKNINTGFDTSEFSIETKTMISKSWKDKFANRKYVTDKNFLNEVDKASDLNNKSAMYKSHIGKYSNGKDNIILFDEYESAKVAERSSGATHIFAKEGRSGGYGTKVTNYLNKNMGNVGAGDGTIDLASLIRHEYGHELMDVGNKDVIKKILSYNNKIPNNDIYKNVSIYAKTNHKEFFAEMYSLVTHPKFNPVNYPKWINDVKILFEGI